VPAAPEAFAAGFFMLQIRPGRAESPGYRRIIAASCKLGVVNMKKYVVFGLLMLISGMPHGVRAEAPRSLAGFVLGGRMSDFENRVDMNTVIATRYLESLKEVEAKEIRGYKTGLVTYGTCIQPPRIVRLKFKYADSSKSFFDALLKRYKMNLGQPDKWRGDPFHIVIAWKWHFTDKDGNRISIILQHNTRDEEEKQGNSVKMTMWNLMLDEDRCFEKHHPETAKPPNFTFKGPDSVNWTPLIPR
jgi:hypothetical protein